MGHPVVIYMGFVSGMFAFTALATSARTALWVFALLHVGTAIGLLILESWEQLAHHASSLLKRAPAWPKGLSLAGAPSRVAHACAWVRAQSHRLRARIQPHLPGTTKASAGRHG